MGSQTHRKVRDPIRLTKASINALPVEPEAYFVAAVNSKGQAIRGLNVRVMFSGQKSFVLRYRFLGAQKSMTLGSWPDMTCEAAERACTDARAEINAGRDPGQAKVIAREKAAEAKKAGTTVADLVDRYVREHIPGNSAGWGKEATRLLKVHVLPKIGNLPLSKVGPGDISSLLYEMKKSTPVQANRTRAVLRTMFGRAEEWSLRPLGSNPVSVVKQRAKEEKRKRRLTDLELKALGAVLQESTEDPTYILAVRLALLAGMRKGEIAKLKWEWVNLDDCLIRIPKDSHKTGAKTNQDRVVLLCSHLANSLREASRARTLGCPYVIPGMPKKVLGNSKVEWAPITALQNPWERIREAAGLAVKGKPDELDPGWHDLRRTFASVGADRGYREFVGELLGHSEQDQTDTYTRASVFTLQDAVEAIGARIEGILTGTIDPEKEAEERRIEMEKRLAKA